MTTRLVALKLTETEYKAALQLIEQGKARTMSCLLRQGLMEIFDQHKLKFETRLAIRRERIVHKMRKAKQKPEETAE